MHTDDDYYAGEDQANLGIIPESQFEPVPATDIKSVILQNQQQSFAN